MDFRIFNPVSLSFSHLVILNEVKDLGGIKMGNVVKIEGNI